MSNNGGGPAGDTTPLSSDFDFVYVHSIDWADDEAEDQDLAFKKMVEEDLPSMVEPVAPPPSKDDGVESSGLHDIDCIDVIGVTASPPLEEALEVLRAELCDMWRKIVDTTQNKVNTAVTALESFPLESIKWNHLLWIFLPLLGISLAILSQRDSFISTPTKIINASPDKVSSIGPIPLPPPEQTTSTALSVVSVTPTMAKVACGSRPPKLPLPHLLPSLAGFNFNLLNLLRLHEIQLKNNVTAAAAETVQHDTILHFRNTVVDSFGNAVTAISEFPYGQHFEQISRWIYDFLYQVKGKLQKLKANVKSVLGKVDVFLQLKL
ncbi:hypothetical protein HDU97_006101 [Phlyctochytrium planicorne]|nr:hypothetical protein HDU97_006101 [Phlyctochytrium planicorne]